MNIEFEEACMHMDFETYEILDNGNYVRDPWGQEPRAIRDEG